MSSIKISEWKELPVGKWLVKDVDGDVSVAKCSFNRDGHKLVVVANRFHFDMPRPVAYQQVPEF